MPTPPPEKPRYLPNIYFNESGDSVYEQSEPLVLMHGDPADTLWWYTHALGYMLKDIDDMSSDGPDGEPGWSQLFDLTRAKTHWLPWVGQLVGYQVPTQPAGMSDAQFAAWDAQQRERIFNRASVHRGSVDILVDVIRDHLNATQTVIVQERYGGDEAIIKIWVYASEVSTSQAALIQAALAEKAKGLILTVQFLTSTQDYEILNASSASYTLMKGKFANYGEVLSNPSRP